MTFKKLFRRFFGAPFSFREVDGMQQQPPRNRWTKPEVGELRVFYNQLGIVVLNIGDHTCVELSPVIAKKLRDQLSTVLDGCITDMAR